MADFLTTLYVYGGRSFSDYRPATPSEILSAARPHLDYEAALDILIDRDAHKARGLTMSNVKAAIDAALGLTEEGT